MIKFKTKNLILLIIFLTSCNLPQKQIKVEEAPILTEEIVEKTLEKTLENSDKYAVDHSLTLYNNIDKIIEEIYLVRGEDEKLLASNLESNSSIFVQWTYYEDTENYLDNYTQWESPYFIIVIEGKEIPITYSKIVNEYVEVSNEQLFITSKWQTNYYGEVSRSTDEIAFFNEEDMYYFSNTPNFLDIEENIENNIEKLDYLYFPQVKRWLRTEEGKLIYAVGLYEEEILKFFPDYKGEIPQYGKTAIISSETIYLEDVYFKGDLTPEGYVDGYNFIEVLNSEEIRTFTTNDVIIVSVDHARNFEVYYRYRDKNGELHRQYVTDQMHNNNNNSVTSRMLDLENSYYNIIPLENLFQADELLSGMIEGNVKKTYVKERDRIDLTNIENGIIEYCFKIDYSEYSNSSELSYAYAFVNPINNTVRFEEGEGVYSNIIDGEITIPMINGETVYYDEFYPITYIWDNAIYYVYYDKSLFETYKQQLREKGFTEYGEVQTVESLWILEKDGTKLIIELYNEENFFIKMYKILIYNKH